jgi:2'-5' RNA ligase
LIRSFIAIPTSEPVREAIAYVQTQLKLSQADVRWESSDKFHLTLKFIGSVEGGRLASLSEILKQSLAPQTPFALTFITAGAFPNIHQPRIIWIGVEPTEDLQKCVRIVEQASSAFGFKPEERPFHAHITLGRVKSGRNLHALTDALKSIMFQPIILACNEIHVVKSELHPAGSVYSIVDSIRLTSQR